MDQEFERRWRGGLLPFDGMTLYLESLLPFSQLQPLLQAVAHSVHHGWRDQKLLTLRDWHEHDGYITAAETTVWHNLLAIVSSPDSLLGACTGDTYVSTAFFPESRDFYLRIYVSDTHDEPEGVCERAGSFDLTGSPQLIDRTQAAVPESAGTPMSQEPARTYFDRSWGG
jgi:hypothetical protein